jgi:hypothetical protein
MRDGWQRILTVAAAEHGAFTRAMADPVAAQERQLRTILSDSQDSAFGRRYAFASTKDIDTFRSRVPVHGYDDVAGEIQAMAGGAPGRLCSSEVLLYEETAGTSGCAKLIPYTEESLRAFRRALYPWLCDLVRAHPGIAEGRGYWALSPISRPSRTTAGGVPVGMASDAGYFGDDLAAAFGDLSVVPHTLASVADIEQWRYLTLRCLLDAEDLSLVSVWSPTFLSPLMESLERSGSTLVDDIERGTVDLPLPPRLEGLGRRFRPDPRRAQRVADALSRRPVATAAIWPALDTISCWTDAGARRFVPDLRAAFPHARLQGKGLLATETAVTIPLARFPHPVLAVNSAFFEFLDGHERSWLCHELRDGERYRVVVTTPGGLYRYDLGDRVLMRGWAEGLPMLEFVGRGGLVSDLCGEKLSEDFVLRNLPGAYGFAMLAPSLTTRPHYILFLDAARTDEKLAAGLASRLDESLRENPQYRYARHLGQLGQVRARRVARPIEAYTSFAVAQGHRLGDIKPPALRLETDWEARFA